MPACRHVTVPREPSCLRSARMSVKALLLILIVVIVVVGSTGGEASAAAIGNAIGEAVHLVRVAWDAMVNRTG